MQNRFRGLTAAPFTPFHADRSVNLDVIPAYARFLSANGVSAAFVCGTTGEGLSLTLDERLAVAEKWTQSAGPKLPVIVHVGHTCLADARALCSPRFLMCRAVVASHCVESRPKKQNTDAERRAAP
jgi:N-acetylneuraminate lyase